MDDKIAWHPLINKQDSSHYDREDGKVAIEEMEKVLSVREMIGFCNASLFKYQWRLDRKGQKEADVRKIKTYNLYLGALVRLLQDGIYEQTIVHRGWELSGQKWRYR